MWGHIAWLEVLSVDVASRGVVMVWSCVEEGGGCGRGVGGWGLGCADVGGGRGRGMGGVELAWKA